VAASTGMVLARPESPLTRRHDVYSSSTPSPLNSRYSVSPSSSRDHSPYIPHRASPSTPTDASPTTGWINDSPQKMSSSRTRRDTPLSAESNSPRTSSGRKPHKLKRRKSSKPSPPLFGWRSKSKSPPAVEEHPLSSGTINNEEHYHLYDIGKRATPTTHTNRRESLASIHSISPNSPRTPLKRIYPPPQKEDSPRLISPNALCQVQTCHTTPAKETPLIKTLRRRTSDTNLSPTRSPGHKRNQSVPSFDSGKPKSPSPEPDAGTNVWPYTRPIRSNEKTLWLVSEDISQDEKFASHARRKLEFDTRRVSNARLSQSPPLIPERCDSLNWDSDSDPTYESMKTENESRRKTRLSSVFDETEFERADIPEHKSPRTVVRMLSGDEEDDLDWGDTISLAKGHQNTTRRLPKNSEVDALSIPSRGASLSRSKSVPPSRPDMSPQRSEKSVKRLSGMPVVVYD